MNTIIILAEALAKASKLDVLRLDINFIADQGIYVGTLWLGEHYMMQKPTIQFCITEDGNVTKGC